MNPSPIISPGVGTSITVSDPDPAVAGNRSSPANDAPTAPAYAPIAMPFRLTLSSVATPWPFVVADPTAWPFNANAIVRPVSGTPSAFNVVETLVVPPNGPAAGATGNGSRMPKAYAFHGEVVAPYIRPSRPMK